MPKLSKSKIEEKEVKEGEKPILLRDSEIIGFGIRISASARRFFVERRIKGQTVSAVRVPVGNYPTMTLDEARQKARQMIMQMDNGVDPRIKMKETAEQDKTLAKVWEDFQAARELAEKTRKNYQSIFDAHLTSWQDTVWHQITPEMVAAKHLLIGKKKKVQANATMRFLRSLMYFAMATWKGVLPANPVTILSERRQWFKEDPRQVVLADDALPKWFNAIQALHDEGREVVADYLVFVLLTGARREEAEAIAWENVNFEQKTIRLVNTKNGEDREIPITRYVESLLKHRRERADGSLFVFPGPGKSGHIAEPKKGVAFIREKIEAHFTIHDLRRTYSTILDELDISAYAHKALMGHKVGKDITGRHYVVTRIKRLREPAQLLEDTILRRAGLIDGNVYQWPKEA